jgi:hypothetical protein
MNRALNFFLISASFASLLFVVNLDSGLAQAETPVNGIIQRDTTWTIAGSPYVFTGAVGVAEGATLTIDAGVTVELGLYRLEVNGSLNAQGTPQQKIIINSTAFNEDILLRYGNPACKLDNVFLNNTSIEAAQSSTSHASLLLIDCSLMGSSVDVWGTTTISDCYVTDHVSLRGASEVSGSILLGGLDVAGSCSGNPFTGTYSISGNNITSRQDGIVLSAGASGEIRDNVIWGGRVGICQADGYETMSVVIENNLIVNNQAGIYTRTETDASNIVGNTIAYNKVGFGNPSPQQTIIGNNFENNTDYNMQAGVYAVSASGNWWGTDDSVLISQGIFDSDDDFSLGTIIYTPFLTSSSVNAPDSPTDLMLPTITVSPTDSVTFQTVNNPSASLGGFEVGVAAALAFVAVSVAVVAVGHRKRA